MKKVMFVLAMLSLGTLCWAGSAREDATDRLDNATSVMHEIMGMPDKGNPGRSVAAREVHSGYTAHGQRRLCLRG